MRPAIALILTALLAACGGGEPEPAREWADRPRGQDFPVWTSVAEIGGRTYHRLRVGALPSVSDTRRLGELISQRYGWPIWVAPLTPADRLPADAVRTTRQLLRGG